MKKALSYLVLMLVATVGWADREVERTIPADPDVRLDIEIISGSLEISGWDRDEVHLEGRIGDDVDELVVEGQGSRILIETDIPDGRSFGRRDISAHLRLRVPVGTRLDVETVSSGIEVEGLRGTLELATVSGSIEVDGAPDVVEAESVSGSIRVSGARSSINAESVSGSVRLDGSAERIEASSVSGSISVRADEVTRGDFESVSGTVEFEGRVPAKARFELSSHSGSVRLFLPADVSAVFDLSTFSGNLDSDFGGVAQRTSKYAPGKTMEFTTGSGSAEISIESFSGNVSVRKR